MSVAPPIPQDIITSIIDELSSDNAALKHCCRVSHAFLLPSQRRLYSTLEIRSETQCDRLKKVLARTPRLLSYARELCISDFADEGTASALAPILQSLLEQGCLRSLSIVSDVARLHWEVFTMEIQTVLLDLFRSPNLISLTINDMYCFPIVHLRRCPQLKRLSLINCVPMIVPTDGNISKTSSEACVGVGYLDSLKIWDTDARPVLDALGHSHSLLRFSRLRELTIGDHWMDEEEEIQFHENVREILMAAASSLRSLHIVPPEKLNFDTMPNLRSLCFEDGTVGLVPLSLLDKVTSDCGLEEIAFILDYTPLSDDIVSDIVKDTAWSKLDSTLHARFPSLRRVAICFDLNMDWGPGPDRPEKLGIAVSQLPQQLPLLQELGVLHVRIGTDSEMEMQF